MSSLSYVNTQKNAINSKCVYTKNQSVGLYDYLPNTL